MPVTVAISINTTWNIVNFRSGLIRALQADGMRVIAIAPPDTFVPRLEAMGVTHYPIAIDAKGLSPWRDLALLAAYRGLLARIRPDVLLGYTIKPNVYGSLAAQSLGIPVINNISGLGTAFIRQGPLTWIVSRLYRAALARSRTVFFQNPEDRAAFLSRRLVRPERARLLPGSGIDPAAFPVADPPGGAPTFLLVARMLRDKGVVEFAEAARMIRKENPDARFQLIGPLDVENRTAISRETVERWQAEGLVEYLGPTDDVRPHIAVADCVVLPSYREGLPRTLLEGAAMARPLIATDVPGCRDIVRNGENGLLCAVRDPAALADAMRRFAALPRDRRLALGRAGRRIVEAEFDERIVVDRYRAAIAAALSRPAA